MHHLLLPNLFIDRFQIKLLDAHPLKHDNRTHRNLNLLVFIPKKKNTPYDLANQGGHEAVLKYLEDSETSIKARDNKTGVRTV